ncbi:MAG: type I-G CRISPR-associated helicase/endonuclease Cas3g [Bryobacteraceae bacterium]
MSGLTAKEFEPFFYELHGRNPFPWQEGLAHEVCEDGWPQVIDVPTGSGKTACIDIAIFALACAERAPRRIFYVVDRRILVNDVYQRMVDIANRLCQAKNGVLGQVAARLKRLSGGVPLRTHELRGSIYRDHAWVKTPLQPMVVSSTVDQVGSRLLFRGYGVSESAWPIHAGLLANDALIFLDEAHCSRAFTQTLERIESYRSGKWAHETLGTPFAFVEMTATPVRSGVRRRRELGPADRAAKLLVDRLYASKKVRLVVSKARPNDRKGFADALVKEALALARDNPKVRRVAILANRVATARHAYDLLRAQELPVELLIGRMRPIDRDVVVEKLKRLRPGNERLDHDPMQFVVATQCLEVGADLDFDVLVSECASVDALLQRFGRLDRVGTFQEARGAVVISAGQANAKEPDAIYGQALTNTWRWLIEIAGDASEVNMGIEARPGESPTVRERLNEYGQQHELKRLGPDAAVLLPMHLDTLVQTSPSPHCEPGVSLFLRGRQQTDADVRIVWRADLDGINSSLWKQVVALCPPSVAEGMPVPIAEFRRWAVGDETAAGSDLEGVEEGDGREKGSTKQFLVWRGEESFTESLIAQLRPGDTVVLSVEQGGLTVFGHLPEDVPPDCAEPAFQESRRRTCLRVHPKLFEQWPVVPELEAISAALTGEDIDQDELMTALEAYRAAASQPEWLAAALEEVTGDARRFDVAGYPPDTGPGVVYIERGFEEDDGHDSTSAGKPILLEEHVNGVRSRAAEFAKALLPDFVECFDAAARLHDSGKSDVRFQALLRGGDLFAAQFAPKDLAKGVVKPRGRAERVRQRERSELPAGFRHELLSLLIAEASNGVNALPQRDLVLHLIASHHGYCRPFAPVVDDAAPREISCEGVGLSAGQRRERAAHRLDSGVADRFWALIRKHGWWGLAYLEAVLRLADWAQSASELEPKKKSADIEKKEEVEHAAARA